MAVSIGAFLTRRAYAPTLAYLTAIGAGTILFFC